MPAGVRIDKNRFIRTAMNADHSGWRLSGHVDSVLDNGVGRFVNQLQRVSICFCKSSAPSKGVRGYIQNDLGEFATKNPGTVVYVIPRRFAKPFAVGEYLNGRQVFQRLNYFTDDEVRRWLDYMRTRSGRQIVAFERAWRTHHPSVQGLWTPFTNDPSDAQVDGFPNDKYSQHVSADLTATEKVLQMFQEQQKGRSENSAAGQIHVVEEDGDVEKTDDRRVAQTS